MADGTDVFLDTERGFDQPQERRDDFFGLLSTSPQVFRGTVDSAITFALAATQDPQAQRWTPLGPRNVGGSMRAIVQDPRTPTTLYAGSGNAGPWKSIDDGYTWRQLGGGPMLVPVGALALAPSNSQVLYVGTGEGFINGIAGRGLFRSDNGGDVFVPVAPSGSGVNGANNYTRIVVDPNEPHRCWAASDTGLWRVEPDGTLHAEPIPLGGGITDVALAPDPANPTHYVLLAGIHSHGMQRGVFDPTATPPSTTWSPVTGAGLPPLPVPPAPPNPGVPSTIGRVRVAFSKTKSGVTSVPWAYAVFQDKGFTPGAAAQGFPTVVLQSTDFGQTWPQRGGATLCHPAPAGSNGGQAFYSLIIEVDPANPSRVLVGYVNLHVSTDGGLTFGTLLDWRLYDNGDRAQHADFHSLLFDVRNARRLWACNDGGISYSPNINSLTPSRFAAGLNPPPSSLPVWRKKSYGITAAMFVDITTHPVYPFIVGGGLQDNGTFVSYGGPTWYRLFGADGGALGMDPADPRRFWPTWQSANEFIQVTTVPPPPPPLPDGSPAPVPPPPENSATLPDVAPPQNVMVPAETRIRFPTAVLHAGQPPEVTHPQTFIGVAANDPVTSNLLLLGRQKGCFYTTNGSDVGLLNTPNFTGDTSTVAFSTAAAPRDMWIGTTSGQLYTTNAALPAVAPTPAEGTAPAAVGPLWTRITVPGVTSAISSIAVHPLNRNVVAFTSWGGSIFLSHDAGTNWQSIKGVAPNTLPPGSLTAVAWDPTDTSVLYAGTLAGVFVVRNLPAQAAGSTPLTAPIAPTPVWNSYSLGLPFSLVNDLEVSTVTNTMRCGTFGRGVFEVNIAGATPADFQIPDVKLSIREHVADDGRNYTAPNIFFSDPRLPAPATAPGDFDHTRAFDIRIDAPGFVRSEAFGFGENIDGVEFDETLVCDAPIAGWLNHVYVQVHNRGAAQANDVQVFLYHADAGDPAAAPAITAEIGFPGLPTVGSAWLVAADMQTIPALQPGQPVVLRFDWKPPLRFLKNVALMAVCRCAQDQLASIPAGPAIDFVKGERRAALRVIELKRDTLLLRDGVDDQGDGSGIAWGGRSPDIIVRQGAAPANPDDPAGDFGDLGDARLDDRARNGANLVFVRVFNRTAVEVNAHVRLFQIQPENATATGGWQLVGGAPLAVNAIPPGSWKFAGPFNWPLTAADVSPGAPDTEKTVGLLALADTFDGATEFDPFPDQTGITDIDSFWRFFLTAPRANNAALRALRFTTQAP